jgi:hypothetical protein
VAAAREAAAKTGDLAKKNDVAEAEQQTDSAAETTEEEIAKLDQPTSQRVAGITATDNPNLFRLWGDRSQTRQIGWLWEGLSENQRNYTNVIQDMSTQTQVVVTQDGLTSVHNFSAGKPQGTITITQKSR